MLFYGKEILAESPRKLGSGSEIWVPAQTFFIEHPAGVARGKTNPLRPLPTIPNLRR
jgi:hypothetical protein